MQGGCGRACPAERGASGDRPSRAAWHAARERQHLLRVSFSQYFAAACQYHLYRASWRGGQCSRRSLVSSLVPRSIAGSVYVRVCPTKQVRSVTLIMDATPDGFFAHVAANSHEKITAGMLSDADNSARLSLAIKRCSSVVTITISSACNLSARIYGTVPRKRTFSPVWWSPSTSANTFRKRQLALRLSRSSPFARLKSYNRGQCLSLTVVSKWCYLQAASKDRSCVVEGAILERLEANVPACRNEIFVTLFVGPKDGLIAVYLALQRYPCQGLLQAEDVNGIRFSRTRPVSHDNMEQ